MRHQAPRMPGNSACAENSLCVMRLGQCRTSGATLSSQKILRDRARHVSELLPVRLY